MDPQARHSTWSLLKKFKNERKCTILLTTHFMDEVINSNRIEIFYFFFKIYLIFF
jgi:ABC-type multidrug transport system ATPase subunit